jgi:hypothetical protein
MEDAQAKLQKLNTTLRDEAEEKDKQILHLEGVAEDFQKALEGEREKIKDLNETIRRKAEHEGELEKYIAKLENDGKDLKSQVDSLTQDKTRVSDQWQHEKNEHARTRNDLATLRHTYNELKRDDDGIRTLLNSQQAETRRHTDTIGTLNARIAELEHVDAELAEEHAVVLALQDQIHRIAREVPSFTKDPKAFIAPAHPDPNAQQAESSRSLANELTRESGTESDFAKAESVDHNSNPSSSPSSDDGEDDNTVIVPQTEVQIQEVIREVYLPGAKIYVQIPYRTSAHSPFTCWVQVEINVAILFHAWLRSAGRAVPFFRSFVKTQIAGNPAHQPPDGGNPQAQTPLAAVPAATQSPIHPANGINEVTSQLPTPQTNGKTHPSTELGDASNALGPALQNGENGTIDGESPTTEGPSRPPTLAMFTAAGIGEGEATEPIPPSPPPTSSKVRKASELIDPVGLAESHEPTVPAIEDLPEEANIPRTSWWWNAEVDPNAPPAAQTLFAFGLHLIFYYFLYVCYSNYCERQLWMSANDSARKLLVEILTLRNPDGRLASHFLSEEYVRTINRAVLWAFSLFKVEPQPWQIPG